MIQLHFEPGSASFTPHVLLREIGVPFELVAVDREARSHKSPAYLALNPNGLIPVFVDGPLVLYETAAICLHLVDTHPQARLAPRVGTAERAHFYKWLVWLSATLQSTLIHYFYPERLVAPGNAAAAAEVEASCEARVATLLAQIDAQLASHGGPWLLGESFSAADVYVFMLCRWTRNFRRSSPAKAHAHIGPFMGRVFDRPAVRATIEAEGLVAPFY
jgi:glutathione S-transferase